MIPFSPPFIHQDAIDEVVDTLTSGWITTGPKTKKFEREITNYCGNKSTLCLNSATFGLELILKWFGVKEGDEVIIPAYTYCATANVIIHCGAKPVMVDINKDDFTISTDAIRNAINTRTKVIIPVDIGGLPCDYDAINELVKEKEKIKLFKPKNEIQQQLGRILVLADAAHSFGAIYGVKKAGALTDISVFSFHAVKNLTTAEGGAIALNMPEPFNNNEIYEELNIMSLHGQSKDAFAKNVIGKWEYDVLYAGYKGNMTDIQASLGLIGLKYYNEILQKRERIFKMYSDAFSKFEWLKLPVYKDKKRTSSFHLFLLRIKNVSEEQRNCIIQKIFDNGVSVNVHYLPLPSMTAYKNMGFSRNDYPISYENYTSEVSLPVYYDLNEKLVKKVIDAVVSSVKEII